MNPASTIYLSTALFCALVVFGSCQQISSETKSQPLRFCSFFNNRAPKAQPGLRNCTWFKEQSCCLQQEIDSTFGRVKPLKGASLGCQKYINYLMCYICAPTQNIFYQNERLTVCADFCNNLFDACGSAILKGSVIRDLYNNGEEFCKSRRFHVNTENCFTFDASDVGTSDASANLHNRLLLLLSLALLCGPRMLSFLHGCTGGWSNIPSQAINRRCHRKGASRRCTAAARIRQPASQGEDVMDPASDQNAKPRSSPVMGTCRRAKPSGFTSTVFITLYLVSMNCVFVSADDRSKQQSDVSPRLNVKIVQDWAQLISNELTTFAKEGLKYKELQSLYDDAQYVTEYVNGTDNLLQVREKLASFFSIKRRLGSVLAKKVQQLHDTWKMKPTSEKMYSHTKQLPQHVYRDADLPHTLPNLQYNSEFKIMLSEKQSTIKLPDEVSRESGAVIDTIQWTAGLDEIFIENRAADPSIRWQYFSSTTGVHRVYPGHEWLRNFVGFHKDYDPRTRPWYVSTTSGPKNIVIIIDASTTMAQAQSLMRAQQVALNVLNTLSKQDRVNVIISKSKYWSERGAMMNTTVSVLSCVKNQLVSASTTHKQEFASAIIEEIVPDGGSNHEEAFHKAFSLLAAAMDESDEGGCQNVVVFITSGVYEDKKQRCKPGVYRFDDQHRKHFVPGEQCYHNFENIVNLVPKLQYKLSKQAHMFTFVTYDSKSQISPPGRLACDNRGAMAHVTNNTEIFRQMTPYFRFLESSSGAEEMVWSSPYRDKLGQGLMITLAIPVHSNVTKQHLGVVGLDMPLDVLDEVVGSHLWGNVYSFIIDAEDDSAVLHPFTKPTAQLLTEPALIPVSVLETHDGEPGEFSEVLDSMQQQKTGYRLIRADAQRAVSLYDSLIWRPVEYTHYVYTDIPGSDFSIAYNMLETDEVYQHARDPSGPTPISYLHQMEKYATLTKSLSTAYRSLSPTTHSPKYPGLSISTGHSVVKLSSRTFCDSSHFNPDNLTAFILLHNYINTDTASPDSQCPDGLLHPDVRPDIKLSSHLESSWTGRRQELQDQILWTFLGTISGMMRIYPGMQLAKGYDPTKRVWYQQAQAHRGMLVLSSVYLDPLHDSKVVTFSRAIHKAKPLTPPDCTVNRRDYGCPCEENHQCKSDYCQDKSCADDIIQGVVAMDTHYHTLEEMIRRVVQQHSPHNYCGQMYGCAENPVVICETRCHLIDYNMDFVTHQDFKNIPKESEHLYFEKPLASVYGYIAHVLLREGLFSKHTRVDYQATCSNHKYDSVGDYWFTLEDSDSSSHACVKEVTYYKVNQSHVRNFTYVHGPLGPDPCSWGHFYFTHIPKTNVFLLVMDNYMDLSSDWNINCRIQSRVMLPSEERVSYSQCAWRLPTLHDHIHYRRRHCPLPRDVPLSCGYSSSPALQRLSQTLSMCLVIAHLLRHTYQIVTS